MSRLALITGASSGIGEALTHLLKTKGYDLILSGRNTEKLKVHDPLAIIPADLRHLRDQKIILDAIETHQPDLIINNAGFGLYGEAVELSLEEQLEMVEVNAKALLAITLKAGKVLKKANKKGTILNISSVGGFYPTSGMSVYGATKSFVTMLSRALDFELKPYGIRVLVSCPGMVSTEFATRAAKKACKDYKGPVMTPEYAAQAIWKQIEKQKEICVFNWRYQITTWLTHFVPKSYIKKMIWKRLQERM